MVALFSVTVIHAQQRTATTSLTILHTSDEHGWLSPVLLNTTTMSGGAATVMGMWKSVEGYPSASIIALSSGDNWTGPALSTSFKGKPVVEVMNAMGYRAAAVGNHEFDFGRAVLARNRAAARFPFLSANATTADGKAVDFAVPYTIIEAAGIKVGIIGLSWRGTKSACSPEIVKDLVFNDYEPTLRTYAPEVRGKGATVVIVIGHVPSAELKALAERIQDLSIPLMLAGHSHQQVQAQVGATWIVESGEHLHSYSRSDLRVDTASGKVTDVATKIVKVEWPKDAAPPAAPDPAITTIIEKWQAKAGPEFSKTIGYTKEGIMRPCPLYSLVTDAWLRSCPEADVALSNIGGFRQNIAPGPITMGDIVGVMPFENTLYLVSLTGAQLLEDLAIGGVAAAGVRKLPDGAVFLLKTSQPVDPVKSYTAVINNFMYSGGDGFPFKRQDPNGRDTKVNWRQPVLDWIVSQNSSPSAPIDDKLDPVPRGFEQRAPPPQ